MGIETRPVYSKHVDQTGTGMDQGKQRRKEKRDIVNPKKRKASPTDDDSDGSTQKKRAGKKSKRQKVPVGLALMHGFSATNVGKSRLTVSTHEN